MNIVANLIAFIILLIAGWVAYEKHDAFRKLVEDIVQYNGLMVDHSQISDIASANDTAPVRMAMVADTMDNQVVNAEPAHKAGIKLPALQQSDSVEKPVKPPVLPPSAALVRPDAASRPRIPQPRQGQDTVMESGLSQSRPMTAQARNEAGRVAAAARSSPQAGDSSAQSRSDGDVNSASAEAGLAINTTNVTQSQDKKPAYPRHTEAIRRTTASFGESPHPLATMPESGFSQRKQNALAGLVTARQAWHRGKVQQAVQQYQYLMREYSNHPDFAGELGNIYFSLGQTELAVTAYSQAIVRLLKNGDYPRARNTLQIIHSLDQQRAYNLQEHFAPLR